VIFESQDDACAGILAGMVKAGDVVIIRNEGPRAGRACRKCFRPPATLPAWASATMRAHHRRPVQRRHGRACIGHVSPEAEEGGPIGLLKAGDRIRIDFPNRRMDILVSEAELAERKKTFQPVKRNLAAGWRATKNSSPTQAVAEF